MSRLDVRGFCDLYRGRYPECAASCKERVLAHGVGAPYRPRGLVRGILRARAAGPG